MDPNCVSPWNRSRVHDSEPSAREQMKASRLIRQTSLNRASSISTMAFSPHGTHVLIGWWNERGEYEAEVRDVRFDARTKRGLPSFKDRITCAAFSPRGPYVLIGAGTRHQPTTSIWDIRSGREFVSLETTRVLLSATFSPDGARVACAWNDGRVELRDAGTGNKVSTVTKHKGTHTSLAFHPKSAFVFVGSDDGVAGMWHTLASHDPLPVSSLFLQMARDRVTSAAFSSTGEELLTASKRTLAKLWSTKTGATIRAYTGHKRWVEHVAFSPNDAYVLTGSADGVVRLFDKMTAKTMATFTDHTTRIVAAVFSKDGSYVLSGSTDRTLRCWNVPLRSLSCWTWARMCCLVTKSRSRPNETLSQFLCASSSIRTKIFTYAFGAHFVEAFHALECVIECRDARIADVENVAAAVNTSMTTTTTSTPTRRKRKRRV